MGGSPNPFEAPREPGTTASGGEAAPSKSRASRTARLVGAIVDILVTAGPSIVATSWQGADEVETTAWRETWEELSGARGGIAQAAAGWWVAWMVVQWVLISRTGRSVGKFVVGTRIETIGGAPAGFFHGVVLRDWPLYLLFYIPIPGALGAWIPLLAVLDVLLIFGPSKRCAHDYIASTVVVRVEAPDRNSGAPTPPMGPIGA